MQDLECIRIIRNVLDVLRINPLNTIGIVEWNVV